MTCAALLLGLLVAPTAAFAQERSDAEKDLWKLADPNGEFRVSEGDDSDTIGVRDAIEFSIEYRDPGAGRATVTAFGTVTASGAQIVVLHGKDWELSPVARVPRITASVLSAPESKAQGLLASVSALRLARITRSVASAAPKRSSAADSLRLRVSASGTVLDDVVHWGRDPSFAQDVRARVLHACLKQFILAGAAEPDDAVRVAEIPVSESIAPWVAGKLLDYACLRSDRALIDSVLANCSVGFPDSLQPSQSIEVQELRLRASRASMAACLELPDDSDGVERLLWSVPVDMATGGIRNRLHLALSRDGRRYVRSVRRLISEGGYLRALEAVRQALDADVAPNDIADSALAADSDVLCEFAETCLSYGMNRKAAINALTRVWRNDGAVSAATLFGREDPRVRAFDVLYRGNERIPDADLRVALGRERNLWVAERLYDEIESPDAQDLRAFQRVIFERLSEGGAVESEVLVPLRRIASMPEWRAWAEVPEVRCCVVKAATESIAWYRGIPAERRRVGVLLGEYIR